MASLPETVKVTGCLYQPAWSGGRSGAASVTSGGVWSSLIVTFALAVPPPVAAQPSIRPAVSSLIVTSRQPDVG